MSINPTSNKDELEKKQKPQVDMKTVLDSKSKDGPKDDSEKDKAGEDKKKGETEKKEETAIFKNNDKSVNYQLLIFQGQAIPDPIELILDPSTTLKQVRILLPDHSNYSFYLKDKIFVNQYSPISKIAQVFTIIGNKQKNIKDIEVQNAVVLKIKNIKQVVEKEKNKTAIKDSSQEMTLIKKTDKGVKSSIVKGSIKQKLSQFRTKLAIPQGFQFTSKTGQIIAKEMQQDYQIQYVAAKSQNESDKKLIVTMIKSLTDDQQDKNLQSQIAKQEKTQKQAKQIISDLDKLQSGMIDKSKTQATKKEIQTKLKQYNVPLKLDLTQNESFDAAKKVFQNQVKTSQGWIDLAQTVDKNQSFKGKLQKNGYVLAPYYSNQHINKLHQLRIVDFENTNIQYFQNLEKSKVLNIAMYDKDVKSNARTEMDKLDNYKFIGASVSASYGPVSASVQVGHAQLSSNQTIKCKKGINQDESITQIFYALCINHAITFLPGDIKLKQGVIFQFQLLVQDYLKTKQIILNDTNLNQKVQLQKLELETRQEINNFLDKYGDGVQNGIYFLGGVYKNTLNYVFRATKTAQELQKIMSNQTQNSLKASVSGGIGAFSAKVGTSLQQKNANIKAQKQFQQRANTGYSCTKSHESYPLNYIQNLNDWLALIQGQRYHWKLIKVQQKESISMKQLLNKPNNQSSSNKSNIKFGQARKEIFEMMERLQNRDYFKFALDSSHPNMATKLKKFDYNQSKIYVDQKTIGLYKEVDKTFTSVCGDTPFYKNKVHNIQASVVKGKQMRIIFGVVSGNNKKHLLTLQDYNDKDAECIYYSFSTNNIYYGNCNVKDDSKNIIHCKPSYKLNDLINMSVDLIQFTITFTLNRVNIGTIDIPLIFLKNGLYPFFGFSKADEILNLTRNLLDFNYQSYVKPIKPEQNNSKSS